MMLTTLLALHSWLRWAVVLVGVAAVILGVVGLLSKSEYGRSTKLANLGYLITMDLQWVIGLGLYFWLGKYAVPEGVEGMGAAMKDGIWRFWAVEHISGMLLGVVVMHVAYAVIKRAASASAKHIWTVVGMGLSWLIIMASIPWPFRAVGRGLFYGLGF